MGDGDAENSELKTRDYDVQSPPSVVVDELDISEVRHSRITRSRLTQFQAVRPALILLLTPLIFLPVPVVLGTKSSRCCYVILIMSVYWATEVIPMSITALIPIAVMPWLGVASSREICPNYFDDANVMFFSGLMLALAVEKWNLHKRIALRVLMLMGSKSLWIMFGFMTITALLSMFISNTGATAMIIPIAVAVLDEMESCQRKQSVAVVQTDDTTSPLTHNEKDHQETKEAASRLQSAEFKRFNSALTLSVALAANIGGTATLIGCGPNVALAGITERFYGSETGVNFISWMSFAFPTMLINLFFSWIILAFMFIPPRKVLQSFRCSFASSVDREPSTVSVVFRREYEKLGPMSFAEGSVLLLFLTTVSLWITRKPDIFPGWSSLLGHSYATEASVGISVCILLFLWPSRRPNFLCYRRKHDRSSPVSTPALLDWPTVHRNLPWSVVLLLGGGFALAYACKTSGLSSDISGLLSSLSVLPQWLMLLLLTVMGTISSTFAGIIPTAAILLPIVAEMGPHIDVNPLALMISVAFAASYSYVLPVSTPPNAIVYAYARFTLMEMVKSGVVMCVIHIVVLQLALNSWGNLVFGLNTFPAWAQRPSTDNSTVVADRL